MKLTQMIEKFAKQGMLTVSWQVPATLPVMYCVQLCRLSRLLRESLVYQVQCCC